MMGLRGVKASRPRTLALSDASVTSPNRASGKRFRGVERLAERGVDRLLDDAARRLRPVANREQRGRSERGVDVTQRDRWRNRDASDHPPPCPFSDCT